jgi:hypothetical protein
MGVDGSSFLWRSVSFESIDRAKGERTMELSGWKLILAWIVCVIVGGAVGFAIGWIVWKLGFELIGSAIALAGAGVGGIIMFFAFMNWSDNRQSRES